MKPDKKRKHFQVKYLNSLEFQKNQKFYMNQYYRELSN